MEHEKQVNVPKPQPIQVFPEKTNNWGVLLFHGLSASTTEVQPISAYLSQHFPELSLYAPLHPGHGTSIHDLHSVTWENIGAHAVQAFDALHERVENIIVMGLSMGGSVAYYTALERDAKAVLTMSTPFQFPLKQRLKINLGALLGMKAVEKAPGSKEFFEEHGLYSYLYHSIPMLKSYSNMLKYLQSRYQELTAPISIHHGLADELVTPNNALLLAQHLTNAKQLTITFYKEGTHIITVSQVKQLLFKNIHSFLAYQISSP